MGPEGAEEIEVVAAIYVLGVEGEAEGQIKAGGEIQDEGAGDAEGGHDQWPFSYSGDAQGSDSEGQHAGRKGDVANVEREAEEAAEDGGHAEHVAEDHRAAPAGDIAGERIGDAGESFGLEFFAEAMFGDGFGEAVIDSPIFEPAAGDAGKPKNNSGEDGEENGAAVDRVERSDGVPGGIVVQERMADESMPEEHENYGADGDGEDVAESGGELRAENAGDVLEELVIARGAAGIADDAGECGTGHGRLFGGEGEVVILHEHEADGVIGADEEAFDEERQAEVGGDKFDGGGADGKQASAEGGAPHVEILGAIGGDVVFAGFPGPFDDFASEQAETVIGEAAQAAVGDAAMDDFAHQTFARGITLVAGRSDEHGDNGFHADEAAMDDVESVDDVEIDAAGVEMGDDGAEFFMAIAEGDVPGLDGFGNAVAGADGEDQRIGSARKTVEREMLDGKLFAAHAQIFGKTEALDAGAEEAESSEERFDDGMPGGGIFGGRSEMRDVIEQDGGQAEETIDFFLRWEDTEEKFGEVDVFAGRGQDTAEKAVGHFGDQAAVRGEAGLSEERDAVGFGEDGGDTFAVAVADKFGMFENGNPDEFAFDVGVAVAGDYFFGSVVGGGERFGDGAVGFAQKFEEGDEGVEAEGENFGRGELFGAEGKFAQGAVVPVEGGKERQNDFAGGLGHGAFPWECTMAGAGGDNFKFRVRKR